MRRFILIFSFLSTSASADPFLTDAFGVVPLISISQERATWSGLQSNSESGSRSNSPEETQTVLYFLGPKSLVAGKDDGHAVALALDRHGNMVANETPAVFRLGSDVASRAETQHGIAELIFVPETNAGLFLSGAMIDGIQSARAEFRVTADLASVATEPRNLLEGIRPETYSNLATGALEDQFGNTVEDGVSLTSILHHENGATSFLTPITSDGMAHATLLVRDITGSGAFSIALGGMVSNPGDFSVTEIHAASPAEVQIAPLADIAAISLRVGPIVTNLGYQLNDGASIQVQVTDARGQTVSTSGWVKDGFFGSVIPLAPNNNSFEVSVETLLGVEHSIVLQTDQPKSQNVRGAK